MKGDYYEKIKENFKGSFEYFINSINYLKDSGILVDFDNKLIIKNKKSVIIPKSFRELLKVRIKMLSRNNDASLMLAYMSLLSERIDFEIFDELGIKDSRKNAEILEGMGIVSVKNDFVYLNNYNIMSEVLRNSMKQEIKEYLAKNILAKLGKGLDNSNMIMVLDILRAYKQNYLISLKNKIQNSSYSQMPWLILSRKTEETPLS